MTAVSLIDHDMVVNPCLHNDINEISPYSFILTPQIYLILLCLCGNFHYSTTLTHLLTPPLPPLLSCPLPSSPRTSVCVACRMPLLTHLCPGLFLSVTLLYLLIHALTPYMPLWCYNYPYGILLYFIPWPLLPYH